MNRSNRSPLDQTGARRKLVAWRKHLVDSSSHCREPQVALVWSRLWLQRRLRRPGSDAGKSAAL